MPLISEGYVGVRDRLYQVQTLHQYQHLWECSDRMTRTKQSAPKAAVRTSHSATRELKVASPAPFDPIIMMH